MNAVPSHLHHRPWDREQRRRVRRFLLVAGLLQFAVGGTLGLATSDRVRWWISNIRQWCTCDMCTPLAPDVIPTPLGWMDYKGFLGRLALVGGATMLAALALPALPARIPGHCPRCNYDLRGLPEARCPECGGSVGASR